MKKLILLIVPCLISFAVFSQTSHTQEGKEEKAAPPIQKINGQEVKMAKPAVKVDVASVQKKIIYMKTTETQSKAKQTPPARKENADIRGEQKAAEGSNPKK